MKKCTINLVLIGVIVLLWACAKNEIAPSENNTDDEITVINGDFPRLLDLPPGGDNGAYDATVATDPATGRVWMVFSRVEGPAGSGRVGTHLAYSDDGGGTWNYSGVINQPQNLSIEDLPEEFSNAVDAYWQHEVPSIVYDSGAPSNQRWRILWHRYLHVDDGIPGNDDRIIANYGWIATKTASTPDGLANANEEKLFSARGYHLTQAIESYNDTYGGVPKIRLHELSPSLSSTIAVTEPGMTSYNGYLYVGFLSRTAMDGFIELIKLDHDTGEWIYVSNLLNPTDASDLNSRWMSFSATDLFVKETEAYLLVSPVSSLYEGSLLFKVTLENGILYKGPNGLPKILWRQDKTAELIQSGVPTYDPGLTTTGILVGDVTLNEPQFKMYATGVKP